MKTKSKIGITFFLLLLSIFNYSKIDGIENIKPIQFISILAIGILSGIAILNVITLLRNK